MRQTPCYSLAQLNNLFKDASVSRNNRHAVVRVSEDSEQEMLLRRIQMHARTGMSRFCKEFQTLSAAAVPTYEFSFDTDHLSQSRLEEAKQLGWVLDNLTSPAPYEFRT